MSRKQGGPRVTWLGRFARGRRPDRNPLRRASDVIETVVLALLIGAFGAGAPFAAQASGRWASTPARHAQITQEQTRYLVPATVLSAPPDQRVLTLGATDMAARWTAPDGKKVTGEAYVPWGTLAGATVRVWTTRDGVITAPPLQDSQIADQAYFTEGCTVAGFAILLFGLGLLARRMLDRRRLAAWDAEWRVTGPRWTTRA